MSEESKVYTTINTSEGLYRYNFLPFGLKASPGIFQSYISKILNNIENVICYQDDILILTETVQEHNETLRKVLNALKEAGVKLNIKKCEFFTDQVQYLGHIFDKDGVKPNPDKVRAILDAPAPRDLKQLQSLVGLCNFYSKFIPNFTNVFAPLYSLLKKEVKFHWGPEQQICLEIIKDLFRSNRVLKLFNPHYETLLETDSSSYGIAAVLLQRKNSNSEWSPVQFISRTLNPAEKNYSNIEREGLSVVFGCEKFRKFLLGSKFIIRNDQQPLKKLFAQNKSVPTTCSARLQRWSLRLSQFNYVFEYSKGINNVNSDYCSRLPLPDTTNECEPYELVFAIKKIDEMPITCVEIQQHTDRDEDLIKLKQYIKYGYPISRDNAKLSFYKNKISEMTIMKGCILFKNRVLIPESLRKLISVFKDNPEP